MAKGQSNPGWKQRAAESPSTAKQKKTVSVSKLVETSAAKRKPIRKQSGFTPAADGLPF